MGLFDKKKEEERSENEQPPVEAGKVEEQPTPAPAEGEQKEKTEEQLREEQAIKLNLVLYNDGQLAVQNGQNCNSPAQAMFMCFLGLTKYLVRDISLSSAQTLINTLIKQKESSNIIVPGARR